MTVWYRLKIVTARESLVFNEVFAWCDARWPDGSWSYGVTKPLLLITVIDAQNGMRSNHHDMMMYFGTPSQRDEFHAAWCDRLDHTEVQ